jgi:hypothetical protein
MLKQMARMPNASKPLQAPEVDSKEGQALADRSTSVSSAGHVFLSYSRDDRDYVTKLAQWLEGHGVQVWFDHDIDYGSKWEAEIETQLDASAVILVVMSKSARGKNWVRRELDRANERKIVILPLLLELDGVVDCVADLQFENVIGGQMPGLRLCQKLPGFLVSEMDIGNALTTAQRDIARHIISAVGGALKLGSKGPGVAALQAELLRVGLDPGPIDGAFGQKTANAVREFQRRRCHIPTADGIVGPLMWMILSNSSLGDLAPATQSEK